MISEVPATETLAALQNFKCSDKSSLYYTRQELARICLGMNALERLAGQSGMEISECLGRFMGFPYHHHTKHRYHKLPCLSAHFKRLLTRDLFCIMLCRLTQKALIVSLLIFLCELIYLCSLLALVQLCEPVLGLIGSLTSALAPLSFAAQLAGR